MCNLFDDMFQTDSVKQCIYCKEYKPVSEYSKHSHHKDRLDSRCKTCIKKHTKIRAQIKKQAPPKPDVCSCCGNPVKPGKWCLDHCHDTNTFRGWICNDCNVGLGKLGDDISGVEKALEYLKKCTIQI